MSSKWSKGSSGPSGDEYINMVVRNPILGSDIVGALNTSDAKMISSQYVNENKVVVEPLLIDGTRVDDVRIYDPPVQTLKERMGTGGNNVPVILGDERTYRNVTGALLGRDSKDLNHEGARDGKLILEQAGHIGFSHTQGLSAQPSEAAWPTLRKEGSGHAVAIPTVTEPTMSVRRLTPLECERLMGWPDHWTETKADGTPQADTHRYKQCGNGVASPVATWIGQQLLNL